ncbi:hypothetical protein Mgra_00007467 [Meloidogyne graminicola]|uniref:Uncharacterized protein n=1 Tax=Meloidogyne graminicola TaxID=189291 RepID=A0A8S9ZIH8_9BILA|nr:hypothetical protein Mgra_00007467 [Meloidogyne graminicola]
MENKILLYLNLFLIIQICSNNLLFIIAISAPKLRSPRAAPGGIDITESLIQETVNSNNIPSLPVVPVLRPPPGWGTPVIPDPPSIQTPTDLASVIEARPPGSAIEETLSVTERGIAGPLIPKIPQITPPPPIIPTQETVLENRLISTQMGF